MNLIQLLIIFLCVCGLFCFPTRPLNERSPPELAWQAWLLVDDQNQNNKQNDATLRRKITPKSVFIAPTFSPESLPPCADGYHSDPMGRCIKIIKLDEAAHLQFLLQKLQEKFGEQSTDYDYDYSEEKVVDAATQGPLQLEIPLDETKMDEGTDIAIVVAPTNAIKRESSTTESQETTTEMPSTTPEIGSTTTEETSTILDVTSTTESPSEDLTTTFSTSTQQNEEETTIIPTSTTPPTTVKNFVRFPDETLESVRFPDQFLIQNTNSHPQQFHNVRDTSLQNHRNRDKHNNLFFLPQSWNSNNSKSSISSSSIINNHSSHQKPLVLRFSRKHAYVDTQQFNHPDYYRSVPPDDLSYIFGFKHKRHSNHNNSHR